MQLKISKSTLNACLSAAKSAYPNEFIGLLEGEKEGSGERLSITITRMFVPPGIVVGNMFSTYSDWMLPITPNVWGSFHSHPSAGVPRPSRQDLRAFSKEGGVHFIASLPYSPKNMAAFDYMGKKLGFEVAGD